MAEFRPTNNVLTSGYASMDNEPQSHEDKRETNKMMVRPKYRKVTSKNEKIRKLDEAITELEEIYASLNLDDEDLLDRAERRDMPSKFQLMRLNSVGTDSGFDIIDGLDHNGNIVPKTQIESPRLHSKPTNNNSIHPMETGWTHPYCDEFFQSRYRHQNLGFVESLLSSSDPPHRCKAPARRRSAIPDPVNDDLAARKMVKRRNEKTIEEKKIQSYLLLSPIYSPSSNKTDISTDVISPENYLSSEPKPDIEKDDLSYRKFIQSDAATVTPAHPPFGIPIGFTDLTTINNYVQATLSEKDRNFFYYRVKPYYPHLIKDDMAFRSFRKDLDRPQDELRKSWINGIKLYPVTTHHLVNQRHESQSRPSSTDSIGHDQVHNHQCYQSNHHQYPMQSFISTGYQNQSSLV